MITLGQKLHAVRKSKSLTLTELASRIDSTASYLSSLERDHVPNPSVTIIRRIADALGVSVAYIVDDNAMFETGDQVLAALMNRIVPLNEEKRAMVGKFLAAIENA